MIATSTLLAFRSAGDIAIGMLKKVGIELKLMPMSYFWTLITPASRFGSLLKSRN